MTIWDASLRSSLIDRARRLKDSTKPAWGKMNAGGMMAHLNDSYRMALGELSGQAAQRAPRASPIIRPLATSPVAPTAC